MITTQTAANTYFQTLAADFNSNEWAAQYEADQIALEFQQWEAAQAANDVPVVQLYSETRPAPAVALPVPTGLPFVAELVQANDAIAATISELNMLVLNTADAATRSQVKGIAAQLVSKAPLMDITKEGYYQMLDTSDVSAACYYVRPVADAAPVTTEPVFTTPSGVGAYKRKYETASEINQYLGTASSLKEVASLYYVNAEMVEFTPWLKKAFTDKKARLYRPSAAAA